MTITEAAQSQIDDIMDTFNFRQAVEGLKANKYCWLNSIAEEAREEHLRKRSRKRLIEVVSETIAKYQYDNQGRNETIIVSGCIRSMCVIDTLDHDDHWIRVDLQAIIEDSFNDGTTFTK